MLTLTLHRHSDTIGYIKYIDRFCKSVLTLLGHQIWPKDLFMFEYKSMPDGLIKSIRLSNLVTLTQQTLSLAGD